MRRAPTSLLLLLLALSGCATYADHLRAGRYGEACEAARADPRLQAQFDRWLGEQVHARLTLVPAATAEALLGGPLAEYGTARGLYQLQLSGPGAKVSLAGLEAPREAPRLLGMLPPLVVPAEPLLPPGPVDPADFTVAPLPPPDQGAGLFLQLAETVVSMGRAVGDLLLLPAAVMMGVVEAVSDPGKFLGLLVSPAPAPHVEIPVHTVRRPAPDRRDALLSGAEFQALAATRLGEWRELKATVAVEYERRLHLGETLDAALGLCDGDGCHYALAPGRASARVTVSFAGREQPCVASLEMALTAPALEGSPRPAWPGPEVPPPVLLQDLQAPSWGVETAATTSLAWNPARAALQVSDLLCTVQTSSRVFKAGAAPPLAVRVTLGRQVPRVQRWLLGPVKSAVSFVIPHADLQPGERLRLSFANAETGRHLGGGLVELAGALPLVVHTDALEARCTQAPAGPLGDRAASLEQRAAPAVEALAAALEAGDALAVARRRQEARQLVVALAMHSGWDSQATRGALRALAAVDPADGARPPAGAGP
jgi:hypothetical protein